MAATTLAMVVQAFAPLSLVPTSRTAVRGSCEWKVPQPALSAETRLSAPDTTLAVSPQPILHGRRQGEALCHTPRIATANSARWGAGAGHLDLTGAGSLQGAGQTRLARRAATGQPQMQAETKPRVVVIGAGWGGWAAAKALCENGCAVTLLDGVPDPSGSKPMLTPTGKPFEVGQRGFWNDYPNIEALLAEKNVLPTALTPLPPLATCWSLAVVTTSGCDNEWTGSHFCALSV